LSNLPTPASGADLTPKADWLTAIPEAADDDDVAEQIAAAIASAGSVQDALEHDASTIAVQAMTGHTLRILGARLLLGTASGKPGYYAVVDAIDETGGNVTVERESGGRLVTETLTIDKGERVALNTGAPSVLAVIAAAYRSGELPFVCTPYLVATSSGRTTLKLGPAETPFD
jgi:hypothetical protein